MKKMLTVAVTAVIALAGCAGLEGKSDEERIVERLETFRAAALEQDIDGVLSVVSDDFYHPEIGGKEQMRLLLDMAIAQGYLDDGDISWADMEVQVSEDGRTATAGPIDASGPPGEIAIIIEGVKGDDGLWYVTSGDLY